MFCVLIGCASSARPIRLAYDYTALGRCGPIARVAVALDRSCTLTVTANSAPTQRVPLAAADCNAIFARAAHEHLEPTGDHCTVPQPFMAGVAVTLANDRALYACWNSELASRLSTLADRTAPGWRDGPVAPATGTDACGTYNFTDDPIQGPL